jgi:hypothetical protein
LRAHGGTIDNSRRSGYKPASLNSERLEEGYMSIDDEEVVRAFRADYEGPIIWTRIGSSGY